VDEERSVRLPRWRKATWALILWSLAILLWLTLGLLSRDCQEEGGDIEEAVCQVGTGVGIGVIVMIGFMGFVVLSLIWLMSRPRLRVCPTCGNEVKRGVTVCQSCGHDFAAADAGRRGTTGGG
jgi:hypothetical protein